MRNLSFFTILLLCMEMVSAQSRLLLSSENFDNYVSGNLGIQGSWIQSGTGSDVQVSNSNPLTYTGYPSGNKYVSLGTSMSGGNYNGRDPYKTFFSNTQVSASPPSGANTVFFISFLVRVNTVRSNGSNIDYILSLGSSAGKTLGHFYVKHSSANTGKINFGVNTKPEIDSTKTSWTKAEFNTSTTYLIAIRYDLVNGSSNDIMYLWVNPDLSFQPAINQSSATLVNGQEDYSSSENIVSLQLHQMDYCPNVNIEFVRVSYGSGESTTAANANNAWASLASPLPVKFLSFKIQKDQKNVALKWTTTEELHVKEYQIERSSDNRQWISIASVGAYNGFHSINDYVYIDNKVSGSRLSYRIKQLDLDGGYSFSTINTIYLEESFTPLIKIQKDKLIVQLTEDSNLPWKIQILDMLGRVHIISEAKGIGSIYTIDTKGKKGHLIIHMYHSNGKQYAKPIIL